ncbi:M48 family metallopeptidase [Henriciella sp.]|jgi:predicted Zn-dependent protease|uniref:M48 family metallopeptidase n=1 Tax=Henriciella sp. TaxID=1968823 RepID=UPI0025BE527F|nr:M48 family metallopeptidase [Henriciella sp.]|tara:strand:- start:109 stop:900 length:792 start_codon:yes stop_codon:yes gene_type:complete
MTTAKPQRAGSFERRTFAGLAASLAFAATACSVNPYTGEQQFAAYDDAQLSQASAQAWQQLRAQTPTLNSGPQYQRVQRVWSRIAAASPKAGEQWDVQVFNSDDVNAFVMPGNRVGVYTGLLDVVENDDQLAAVLGHEVAHAIYRHANQRATRQAAASAAVQVGAAAAGNSGLGVSANQVNALGSVAANLGVVLPYSRNAELEADLAGVDYMVRAGYDPRAAIRLWEVMQQNNSQRTADFLSTHPNPDIRQQRIREYIQQKGY